MAGTPQSAAAVERIGQLSKDKRRAKSAWTDQLSSQNLRSAARADAAHYFGRHANRRFVPMDRCRPPVELLVRVESAASYE
uniref:Transposase n=1 Tax=Globodera pallida TaxID=36090 RepID=A0A183C8L5_GLOPA